MATSTSGLPSPSASIHAAAVARRPRGSITESSRKTPLPRFVNSFGLDRGEEQVRLCRRHCSRPTWLNGLRPKAEQRHFAVGLALVLQSRTELVETMQISSFAIAIEVDCGNVASESILPSGQCD